MNLIDVVRKKYMKEALPTFAVGDTVRVSVKVKEGERVRIQVFEGVVIAKKHGQIEETFTVRKIAHGVGVERVFPIHSPFVENVEVTRKGKVRRCKLYYLRGRIGKAAKVKEAL
ncbi:MAG: 50S ribosomal protein L19 [Oscillospiraceae bacterium]|jgi:large subunit ribosomal protein L19|nr:50S ribosomal protein L19 [Oscillospiraceae bacterium]